VANNTATQVGGGIYATRNSTANISHSTIINNNGFIGGGIVIVNGAQITITDCLIQGNSTDEHGGGVHCTSQSEVSLLDVIVRENTSTLLGAGVHVNRGSTMNLNRVQIIDNRGDTGGGIALRAGSEFNAIDVDVIGNFSNGPGGGIYSEESFSTMTNCNFLGNSCPNQGGGQFFMGGTSVQTRCVIADNECSRVAAVYNLWADLSYRNCTIANNRGEEIGEIHSVQGEINLLNSIIWNENNSIITTSNNDEETIIVSYCDITGGRDGLVVDEQDNINWGEGNIDEDPLFADIDELDYHLTEDSPCIDVGDPDAEPDPDDTRRDMGAYYFHQENNNPELQHFVDVQETDVSHLILVEEVQFDDEPVADGWEIGVFTRDDVLSGAVVWGDGGAELIAYGDNQETEDVEGFYPDEYLLSFRAWNPETDMVHRFGFDVDVGGWEWNNEDETTVSLWSNPEIVEQRIELNEHWNMISLNIRPSRQFYVRFGNDEFPDVVCMTLQFWDGPERHHHILLKNGLGHFYVPAWGFHQIPGWMPDEGYQILMDTDMTGTWWGTQIAPEEEIALREGWGIYAYYPGYELDASAPDFYVLSNIIENVELAKDEDGSFIATEFNFSNMPPWRAGEGYQIKTTQECVLVYPEQRDEELNASENTLIRHWHQPAPTGNNMSILVDLKDVVSKNSEIAAFTESGQLVGCGVVNENGQCGLA
ncbi:MAG: right-handed parallel beta-helix repeat-containing protein, partial [Calditrichaeota bacterium]|nr:right-handed parallel beta-helix repeat-containing protein [Calditrichota bacterium]